MNFLNWKVKLDGTPYYKWRNGEKKREGNVNSGYSVYGYLSGNYVITEQVMPTVGDGPPYAFKADAVELAQVVDPDPDPDPNPDPNTIEIQPHQVFVKIGSELVLYNHPGCVLELA